MSTFADVTLLEFQLALVCVVACFAVALSWTLIAAPEPLTMDNELPGRPVPEEALDVVTTTSEPVAWDADMELMLSVTPFSEVVATTVLV